MKLELPISNRIDQRVTGDICSINNEGDLVRLLGYYGNLANQKNMEQIFALETYVELKLFKAKLHERASAAKDLCYFLSNDYTDPAYKALDNYCEILMKHLPDIFKD